MDFLRLNLADDYDNNIGGVDISDQLLLQHKIDSWMRLQKWWWVFFP